MAEKMELVKSFHDHCDEAARAMLVQIAAALDVEALERVHRVTEPSETGLKLISEPSVPLAANDVENKHRDSGTLTMLFYDSWSMHICLSQGGGGNDNDDAEEGQGEWVFVPPPPDGCALVHGASSLHRLSGGRLRAPLHRVTQPADGAGMRYFLSYFLRPEHRLREEWDMADGSGST
jgi:isopenicillin N synthase-like dioxygenase